MKENKKNIEQLAGKLESLYIELTTRCNLLCNYCYNMSSNGSKQVEINKKLLFNVLLKASRDENAKCLILSGGEPLLYPYIIDVCSWATSLGYKIVIITNGSLLTQEFIRNIMPYKPCFQITLDSYDEQINDFYKGVGAYRKILQGLHLLATEYDMEYVVVRCNLTKEFLEEGQAIDKFVSFLKNYSVRKLYFSLIMKQGRAMGQSYPSREAEVAKLMEFRNRVSAYALNEDNDLQIETGFGICLSCPYISSEAYTGKYMLHITPRGDVYPCNSLAYNPKYLLGNLNNATITEIFRGKTMSSTIENIVRENEVLKKCVMCNYRHFCGKGCAAENDSLFYENAIENECNLRRMEMNCIIRNTIN